MSIQIDLRRDIHKVRERVNLSAMGDCLYASPCAIGAMIDDPDARRHLDITYGTTSAVSLLLDERRIRCPHEQRYDLVRLQDRFDNGTRESFLELLSWLEDKYAAPNGEAVNA